MNKNININCKICNNYTSYLLNKKLLNKYLVNFYQCEKCKFIQAEHPFWLEEAYSSAIADLDIGLVYRNNFWAPIVEQIIKKNFNLNNKFIDFGGGYGLFVRLMRDRGINFYRQDIYCENIFANYFDVKDIDPKTKFELLTAFEVFEHLPNPMNEIEAMFEYSNSILFSTELQPSSLKTKITKINLADWHYFTPETGQHIALFHLETLKYIAKKFNKNLFTDKKISNFEFNKLKFNRFKTGLIKFILKKSNLTNKALTSLLRNDYEFIKNKNL